MIDTVTGKKHNLYLFSVSVKHNLYLFSECTQIKCFYLLEGNFCARLPFI